MLHQSLRAFAQHRGMHVLRRVAALFLANILMVSALQFVGEHPVAVAAPADDKQKSEVLPSVGVTPDNQNQNDLYISNIKVWRYGATKETVDTAALAVNDSIGRLYLDWSNKHPNQQVEQPPTVGKSFTFELPRQLWFDRVGKQRNDVPMLFGDRSVGDCVFYSDNNRLVTCKLNEGAVQVWKEGFHSLHGEFRIDMINAGYGKPQNGKLPAKVKSGENETVVELVLPGGEIKAESPPGNDPRWLKSNNFPSGPHERISWYFLFNGAKLVEKLGAEKVNGRDEFSLIIDEHAEAPLKFDPARQKLDLRTNTWLRPCTLEDLEKNRRGIDCGMKSAKVNAKMEFKPNPTDPTRAEIHITYPFAPDVHYAFSGVVTEVFGNIVQERKYRNNARMFLRQPDGSKGVEIAGTGPSGNNVAEWRRSASATAVAFSSFAIDKRLGGENPFAYVPGQEVEFEYRYELKEGTTFANYPNLEKLRNKSVSLDAADRIPEVSERGGVAKMKVRIDGGKTFPTVDNAPVDFPKDTKITLREIVDPQIPQHVDAEHEVDYFWETPKYNGKKVDTIEFTISEQGHLHLVEAENINYGMYPIYIAKKWQGIEEAARPENVEFKYTCTGEGVDNAEKTFVYNARGAEKQLVGKFRAGTKCQFKEVTEGVAGPANMDLTPQWSPAVENEAAKGEAIADKDNVDKRTATVTNVYSPSNGAFKVRKAVEGVANVPAGKSFAFAYSCAVAGQDPVTGEFVVPANGEAGPDREFPLGTECTVEEKDQGLDIDGYQSPTLEKAKRVTVGQAEPVTFTNRYTPLRTFKIAKRVEGVAPEAMPADKKFLFTVQCTVAGRPVPDVNVEVPANGEAPVGTSFPENAECRIAEQDGSTTIAGYDLNKLPEPQSVTLNGADEKTVTFTNAYSRSNGAFKVRKVVEGVANVPAGKSFTFAYSCAVAGQDPVTGEFAVPANGEAGPDREFPLGTVCSVHEKDGEGRKLDGYSDPIVTDRQDVTVGQAEPVTFTNRYTPLRTFKIAKRVEGISPEAIAGDLKFQFDVQCNIPNAPAQHVKVEVPANGEAPVGINVPENSECVVTEEPSANDAIAGYDLNKLPEPQSVTLNGADEKTVTFTNAYSRSNGTFKIRKQVVGAPAADKSFTFEYSCAVTGQDAIAGSVVVPANGEAVEVGQEFPIGARCDVSEKLDDPGLVIEGYDFVAPPKQSVVVSADEQTLNFENRYAPKGTFEVVKRVEGVADADVAGKTYNFDYTCVVGGDPQVGEIRDVLPTGEVKAAGVSFPVGTKCTVTEQKSSIDGYSQAEHTPVNVVIGGPTEPVAKAEFVNKYTRDVGSLKLRKVVAGDNRAVFSGEDFELRYTCGGAEPVTVRVKGDGAWTEVRDIPTGTKCLVEEVADTAGRAGYSVAAKVDNPAVTIVKDKAAESTVTNTYTQNKGGFTVSKVVTGTGSGLAKDKEFTFKYRCVDQAGTVVAEDAALKVKAGETKRISDVPELATCEVEELDAEIEHTDWVGRVTAEVDDTPGAAPAADKPAAPAAPVAEDKPAVPAAAVNAVPVADVVEDAEDGAPAAPADERVVPVAPAADEPAAPAEDKPAAPAAPAEDKPAEPAAPAAPAEDKPAEPANVDDRKVTFGIDSGKTVMVTGRNEYNSHVGTFSIAKVVEGDLSALFKAKRFIFDVTCSNGLTDAVEVVGDGHAVRSEKLAALPVGTSCEISENVEQAQIAEFDLKAPEKQTVKITKRDEVVPTTFTNVYSAHTGGFSVAKQVKGLASDVAKDKEYTFNFECTDRQKGQVKVKGDGQAVDAGVKVRSSSECTVTEDAASAEVQGYTVKIPEAQTVKIAVKDAKESVTFTNEYTPVEDPKPVPPTTPQRPTPPTDRPNPPTDTDGIPGILSFIPFVPWLFGNAGSSTKDPVNAAPAAERVPNQPSATTQPDGQAASQVGQRGLLANTGASVIGIGIFAVIITVAGIALAVRGRKSKS